MDDPDTIRRVPLDEIEWLLKSARRTAAGEDLTDAERARAADLRDELAELMGYSPQRGRA